MRDELVTTALMGVVGVPLLVLLVFGGRRIDRGLPAKSSLRRQLGWGFLAVGVIFLVVSFPVMATAAMGPTLFWSGATMIAVGLLNLESSARR